jgi:divalent metal cation (Fe/Co/Zn/Cd) transporter
MKEELKVLGLLTILFFILMIGGTIINFTLALVFSEPFNNIQNSGIWIIHVFVVICVGLSYVLKQVDN